MRKALGIVMLATGVLGIILSIAGIVAGRRLVDSMGQGLQSNLTTTLESLETVRETLILTKLTVGQLSDGLSTVEDTADNVSVAIDDTRPLLEQSSTVTTEQLPESIEAFQETMPALVEVAGTIDDTLRTLDAFNPERSILGIPFDFDLGVEYDPEVPFDESVSDLGASLEGVPEQLRSLRQYLETTNSNLRTISRNVSSISTNLGTINSSISRMEPLLDEYITIITNLSDSTRQARLLLQRQLGQVKLVLTVALVWLGLTQIAPLYLGWELVTGRRAGQPDEEDS